MNPPSSHTAASERTIVRPTPGGRGMRHAAGANRRAVSDATGESAYIAPQTAHNPILAAAQPLLAIAPKIRQSATHPDPHRLKDELTKSLRNFEHHATVANIAPQHVIAARYVLCTFLDECAASTPWGAGGIWARDTLLVRLHNETWGGEKVFQLLARLAQTPKANLDLLELIYVCLALGFEGKYKVADNGRSQLDLIRDRLQQMIREQRPSPEAALSQHWRPTPVVAQKWFAMTPLWVVLVACMLAATLLYVFYLTRLNEQSDPVFSKLQSIRPASIASLPVPVAPPAATPPHLAGFLQKEINAGLVSVSEVGNKSTISIRGDGLFESGGAQINDSYLPLIDRIGEELKQRGGKVLVSGHTDSVPVRSARFPSNFHLSQERAELVAKRIGNQIGLDRIRAEGKADAEPIAPNATSAGRAKNRRVEITLITP